MLAVHSGKPAAEMQQELLSAGWKCVVPDQQQPPDRAQRREASDRPARRIQERAAEMHIRLKIGALSPFVPGIDADQRGAEERMLFGLAYQSFQPGLVFRRRPPLHDEPGSLSPCVVVPAGNNRLDEWEIWPRDAQRLRYDHVVIVHVPGEFRVQVVQAVVREREPLHQFVRRELGGAVHTERGRIVVVEALRHDEYRVLAMVLAKQQAPSRDAACYIGNEAGAVDHQEWAIAEANVAGIGEMTGEGSDQARLVFGPVVLRDQHVFLGTVPAPRPVLVRPYEAIKWLCSDLRASAQLCKSADYIDEFAC